MIPFLLLLSALWGGPGWAVLTWQGAGCLYRQPQGGTPVLVACYPREGSYTVELGNIGPLDAAYRPAAGDIYTLWRPDGSIEQAPLRSIVYFPGFVG